MGQITQTAIEMFKGLLEQGQHINSTHSEEEQLVFAWEELQAIRRSNKELRDALEEIEKIIGAIKRVNTFPKASNSGSFSVAASDKALAVIAALSAANKGEKG